MGKQLLTSLLLCLLVANGGGAAEGPSRFVFPAGEQALMDLLRRLPVLSSDPNAEVQNFQFTWKLRGKCEAAEKIVAELATLPIDEALDQSLRARDANPPTMHLGVERQQKVCGAVFLSSQAIPWLHWNDNRMTAVSHANAGKFLVFSNLGFTFTISEENSTTWHGFGYRTEGSQIDLDISDSLRCRLKDAYDLAYSLQKAAIVVRKRATGSYIYVELASDADRNRFPIERLLLQSFDGTCVEFDDFRIEDIKDNSILSLAESADDRPVADARGSLLSVSSTILFAFFGRLEGDANAEADGRRLAERLPGLKLAKREEPAAQDNSESRSLKK